MTGELGGRAADALAIWQAGVAAVQPSQAVPAALAAASIPWVQVPRCWVVGGGKAGSAMAEATARFLRDKGLPSERLAGWVNVPAESARPLPGITLHPARPLGINYPTAAAVAGSEQILSLLDRVGPGEWILCLISGGGSALLCAPAPGLTLEDKQQTTQLLHRSGADIREMNTVRKHLSRIKGGGLTQRLFARGDHGQRLLGLVISDVIGDPLDVIASGPTCPDPTTFGEALEIVERRGLRAELPAAVLARLERGRAGQEAETLKKLPEGPAGEALVLHRLIASQRHAVQAAAAAAKRLGYEPQAEEQPFAGDVLAEVKRVATQLREHLARTVGRPLALIAGGEPTVVLPPQPGRGGRNQHFILALAAELTPAEWDRITVLCAGTDGEDGPTDAAGAFLDRERAARLRGQPLAEHLARFDAYPLLDAADALVRTGLTDTNVMDLRVMLLHQASSGPAGGA